MGIEVTAVVGNRIDTAGTVRGQIEIAARVNTREFGFPVRFEGYSDENDPYRIRINGGSAENPPALTCAIEHVPARYTVKQEHPRSVHRLDRFGPIRISLEYITRSCTLEGRNAAIPRT